MFQNTKKFILTNTRFQAACLLSLLPLVLCMITSALQGQGIWNVYIPGSEWNDELFYFKQVEGMLANGFPYGYFGFNESHAQVLSFAAWSPILVLPWILFGILFGWSFMTPIYANIVFMMVAMFLFVWIVQPTWKQLLGLVALYVAFTPFTRYMMSSMPECICFSLLIIFFSCAYGYLKEERNNLLIWMFILSSILTLMRPYLIVFLLLPMFYLYLQKKWTGLLISGIVLAFVGGTYALIKVYLGAEYFTALYDLSWISTFLNDGIVAGVQNMFSKLYYMGWDFVGKSQLGITEGLASGAFFVAFVSVILILCFYVGTLIYKKERKEVILYGHLLFSFVAMWIALLLMYKMTEGSKHLLTFIAVGIYAIAMMKGKWAIQIIIPVAIFSYLFIFMAKDPYDYQIPYETTELIAEIEYVTEALNEQIFLQTEQVPSFDNTVIWVFSDIVSGENQLTDWQILYTLPEGFGISCCMPSYILENFENLQSKYICVPKGGEIEALCQSYNLKLITQGMNSVIYEMH